MPNIGGVTFLIDSDFVISASGSPNNISNPYVVSGIDYGQLHAIEVALNSLFGAGSATADFLQSLAGKTIYVTKDLFFAMAAGNASFLTNGTLNSLVKKGMANPAASKTFFADVPFLQQVTTTDAAGNVITSISVNTFSALPYSATSAFGYLDMRLNGVFNAADPLFQFLDPSKHLHDETLLRTMFHELAHAATLDISKTAWQTQRIPPNPQNPFNTTAESIAIDAENLAYIRGNILSDRSVRIGHNTDPRPTSNDPTLPFSGSGNVTYAGRGRLTAPQQAGTIGKTYRESNYTVNISSQQTRLINYITIDAAGPIFKANGSVSPLLTKALSGISHDNSLESRTLSMVTDELQYLNRIGSAASGGASISNIGVLTGISLSGVQAAIGLTNELSVTEEPITGPYKLVNGAYQPAEQLYLSPLNSSTGSLLIGASGARLNNVDYRTRTDYIVGSSADDILLAGTGKSSNGLLVNMLFGGGGNDALVGNKFADDLKGEDGDDVLFQSEGKDILDGGNGVDAFVVAKGTGSQTIDLSSVAPGGPVTLTRGTSTSVVKNVEVFVGNDARTTFIGNGHSVFVSGTGGGDFTLHAGDVAIGDPNSGVGNIYRLTSTEAGKVRILNFNKNDKVYIDGKLFTYYKYTSSVAESKLYVDNPNAPDVIWNYAGIQTSMDGSLSGTVNSLNFGTSGYVSASGTAKTLVNMTPSSDMANSVVSIQFSSIEADGALTDGMQIVLTGYQDGDGGIKIRSDGLSLSRLSGNLDNFGEYYWSGHVFTDLRGQYLDYLGTHSYSKEIYSPFDPEWLQITQGTAQTADQLLSDYSWSMTTLLGISGMGGNESRYPTSLGSDILVTGTRDPLAYEVSGDDAVLLEGDESANTLDAAGGYNLLVGHGGGDTFVYSAGDGLVAIDERDAELASDNVLQLGTGLDPESVSVFGDTDGNLVLDFGNDDVVVLVRALTAPNTAGEVPGVQKIIFANGTEWSYDDLLGAALTPSASNEALVGDWRGNLIDGLGIARELIGNGGGDTFYYEAGYGQLLIDERDGTLGFDNILRFGAGISADQLVVFGTEAGDLVLNLGNGDAVTIKGALLRTDDHGISHGVQSVTFVDGTVLDYADILSLALMADGGKSALVGDGGANVFEAVGITRAIIGNGGGDTVFYNAGEGYLQIDERDGVATPDNKLVFGAGIDAANILVVGDELGNITLDIGGGDSVALINALNSTDATSYGVQHIQFDDGTVWSYADLLAKSITASSENRALFGDRNANLFDGQGYATSITGGGGGDTFHYDLGDGPLEILEVDEAASPANILEFGSGIDVADVHVSGNTEGDLILDIGNGDRITLLGGLESEDGAAYGVQTVRFSDGSELSYANLLDLAITAEAGDTAIYGDRSANLLDVAGIVTLAVGNGGGDTFVYERGYGAVAIDEREEATASNRILFGADISAADISVSGAANGDMILSLGNGDTVTLLGALRSLNGVTNGIQLIEFEDGSTVSYNELLSQLGDAVPGVATLYGDTSANVLDSAGIAATLVGNGGGDTFLYEAGYGSLVIDEQDATGSTYNLLQFGAGLNAGAMTVRGASNGDLVLDFGSGDVITLRGALEFFDAEGVLHGVQWFSFADGTLLTYPELLELSLTASISNTELYGDSAANELAGNGLAHLLVGNGGGDIFRFDQGEGALTIDERDGSGAINSLELGDNLDPEMLAVTGNDVGDILLDFGDGDVVTLKGALFGTDAEGVVHGLQSIRFANGVEIDHAELLRLVGTTLAGGQTLYGDTGANIFDGSGIAARIVGNGGGDTIYYHQGYGPLTIDEADSSLNPMNRLILGEGILPSQVTVSAGPDGDLVLDFGGTDIVTLAGALNPVGGVARGVQAIEFAGGVVWNTTALLASLSSERAIDLSAGDFELDLGSLPMSQAPALVLDVLPADVTVSLTSDGQQLRLQTASGNALIVDGIQTSGPRQQQTIRFADDTIWHIDDAIDQVSNWGEVGSVLIGTGAAEIFRASGHFNVLVGGGGGDAFQFARGDGEVFITELDDAADAANRIVLGAGIGVSDLIVTSDFANDDTLKLNFGDGDVIYLVRGVHVDAGSPFGVQEVEFSDGQVLDYSDLMALADTGSANNAGQLIGDSFANIIDPAGWSHSAYGNGGNDTFIFNAGYGLLTIDERDVPGAENVLQLGTGLLPADAQVQAENTSLRIIFPNGDVVLLLYAISDYEGKVYGVQKVVFDDGTIWNSHDLLVKAGLVGLDLVGDNTANTLVGTSKADTFDGKRGDDLLSGGAGNDEYRYASGDGGDQIDDTGSAADVDILKLSDISADSVLMRRDGADLIVLDAATGAEIRVLGQFDPAGTKGIEQVSFVDGASWDRARIMQEAGIQGGPGGDNLTGTSVRESLWGLAGDDTLKALGGNDVLIGGTGSDTLTGGGGNDVYYFAVGDGQDVIDDLGDGSGGAGGADVLEFGMGITPDDVSVRQADGASLGSDYVLTIATGPDTVTIKGGNEVSLDKRIEQVHFADGTTWSVADLMARSTIPTAGDDSFYGNEQGQTLMGEGGNDLLRGRGGDDILIGGTGNDNLGGAMGNDLYLFARGDGQDIVGDGRAASNYNAVVFDTGIRPDDVYIYPSTSGTDVVIGLLGGTDRITVSLMNSNTAYGVDEIRFADGTVWTYTEIMARRTAFTEANDTISGTTGSETLFGAGGNDTLKGLAGNDSLAGGTGSDTLIGGGGDDVYHYGIGDGADIVNDYGDGTGGAGGTDTVQFEAGILPANVTVSEANTGNDFVLTIAGGGSVTLQGSIIDPNKRIEQVRFADGTVWTHADLMVRGTIPTSGNDSFYGDADGQTLSGGAGSDYLAGRAGNDRLIGGTGNDTLLGANGSDTYVFNPGDGQDVITDVRVAGVTNVIEFGAGISASDLVLSTADNGHDVVIGIAGTTDRITVDEMNFSTASGVDELHFVDATVWTYADIMAALSGGQSNSVMALSALDTAEMEATSVTSDAEVESVASDAGSFDSVADASRLAEACAAALTPRESVYALGELDLEPRLWGGSAQLATPVTWARPALA